MFSTHSMFGGTGGSRKLLAFILIFAVSAALLALREGGWLSAIFVSVLVLVLLWLTKSMWNPEPIQSAKLQVATASLTVFSGIMLAALGRAPESKPWIEKVLTLVHLQAKSPETVANTSRVVSVAVVFVTFLAFLFVNWLFRDNSAMGKVAEPLDKDFPDPTYRERLKNFSNILLTRLNTLDTETKWDDYFYAPLEAEVEIISRRRSRRRIVDLLEALKTESASRMILVLGDPGAGKSIALRKLAKELLNEVDRTGRLPVYVNLKEWNTDHVWDEHTPPNVTDLREFVLDVMRGDSSVRGDSTTFVGGFLEAFFDPMLKAGRFFFIFDSFDEIPGVLDVSEASWLIQHLSSLFTEFIVSQNNGRGIVASRVYRRPQFSYALFPTLEIRPFSDLRIHEALTKTHRLKPETIEYLFKSRPELVPIARNPFSAALIRMYAERNGGALPSNQLEMYESYINGRLDASKEELARHTLTRQNVIDAATQIAVSMFEASDVGLEITLSRLSQLLPGLNIPAITGILRFSSLARLSQSSEPRFSFVHRRLNEYFVARRLLTNPELVSFNAIPTDSRYRDALVLYCEVGSPQHVQAIAEFCWARVDASPGSLDDGSQQQIESIHCLRFLRDAFASRISTLSFQPQLTEYIERRVQPGSDLLAAKLALEAVGLLPERDAEPILMAAFAIGNSWISETALRSCRHLSRLEPALERRMQSYLASIPMAEFLKRRRELTFSLSLSDAFQNIRRYCIVQTWDYRMFLAALVLCFFIAPTAILVTFAFFLFNRALSTFARGNRTAVGIAMSRIYASLLVALLISKTLTQQIGTASLPHLPRWVTFANVLGPVPLLWIVHGPAIHYVTAAAILCALLLFPFCDAYRSARGVQWRQVAQFDNALVLLGTLASMAVLGLVFYGIEILARHFPILEKIFYVLLIVPGTLGFLYYIGKELRNRYSDARLLRSNTTSISLTRSDVAAAFEAFHTYSYRLKYVQWIQDQQITPMGVWTNGRPNHRDDKASALLAQLDERWLGLDT